MSQGNRFTLCVLALLLLPGVTAAEASAQESGWLLNIEIPGARSEQAPAINPNENPPILPKLDSKNGRWFIPITHDTQQFVNSYVVSAHDKSVIAIQIGVPSRLISGNQYVYLKPPAVESVDESAVSLLWSTNRIMSEPADARTQFGYLQDLVYVNQEIMQRSGSNKGTRSNAMSLRAAFMLLQVVRNLAAHTWYVVDNDTKQVIDYARDQVAQGSVENRYCRWLGSAACSNQGPQSLERTVKALEAARFVRMYSMLVPDGSILDQSFCNEAKIKDLKDFWLYFKNSHSGEVSIKGLNNGRLLNDLAACQVSNALCTPKDNAKIIEELSDAKRILESNLSPETMKRLREVSQAHADVASGKPAVCPIKRK